LRSPCSAAIALAAAVASATSTASAADTAAVQLRRFEVWVEGSYAVAPLVVDPLGAIRFRVRQVLVSNFVLGLEGGSGLACLESCAATTAWVIQVPLSLDVAYVLGSADRAGFEVAAGYGVAPSFPLGAGATHIVHGPLVAVRARAGRNANWSLAAGFQAQLAFVAPAAPFEQTVALIFEQTVALIVGPMVGVVF
jgi:hypothetical protein